MPRPLLSTLTFIVFNISFVYAQGLDSIYIQPQEYELETFNFSSTLISDPEIDELLSDYVIYDVDFSDINDFISSSGEMKNFNISFDGNTVNFKLRSNDLRALNCMYVHFDNNEMIEEVRDPDLEKENGERIIQFKGFTNDNPVEHARLTINSDNFWGYISFFQEEVMRYRMFENLYEFLKSKGVENIPPEYQDMLVSYLPENLTGESMGSCMEPEITISEDDKGKAGYLDACTPKVLNIAAAGDYEFYQLYGTPNGYNRILSILNHAEGIYTETFNLAFNVVKLVSQSSSNQPYTSHWAETRVTEFKTYWGNTMPNYGEDAKILFSGLNRFKRRDYNGNVRNDVVGRVYEIGVICSAFDYQYALISNSTDPLTPAHEIGHLFGAIHIDGNSLECQDSEVGMMCQVSGRELTFEDQSIDKITEHINDYGLCLDDYMGGGNNSDWLKSWTNQTDNRWLGFWYLGAGTYLSDDFDGDGEDELFTAGDSPGWAMLQDFICSPGFDWEYKWSNMGIGSIGFWNLGNFQQFNSGDFDGDGAAELFSMSFASISTNFWAMVQSYNTSSHTWDYRWSNMGDGKIDNVSIDKDNFNTIGDFDGDGKDELFMASESTSWLFDLENGSFNLKTSGSGIPNHDDANTVILTGYFSQALKQELLVFEGTSVYLIGLNSSNNAWNLVWYQPGGGNVFGGQSVLPVSKNRVVSGAFDYDGKDEVIILDQAAASFDFNGTDFQCNWKNYSNGYLNDWNTTGFGNSYFTVNNPTFQDGVDHIMAFKTNFQNNTLRIEKVSMFKGGLDASKKWEGSNPQDLESSDNDNVFIFPNPANHIINIEYKDGFSEGDILQVLSFNGKVVSSYDLNGESSQINSTDLVDGIYFLRFRVDGTRWYTSKVMIRNSIK